MHYPTITLRWGVESTPRQPRTAAKGPEVHVVEDALDSERRMDVHRASFAFDVPWSWGPWDER